MNISSSHFKWRVNTERTSEKSGLTAGEKGTRRRKEHSQQQARQEHSQPTAGGKKQNTREDQKKQDEWKGAHSADRIQQIEEQHNQHKASEGVTKSRTGTTRGEVRTMRRCENQEVSENRR